MEFLEKNIEEFIGKFLEESISEIPAGFSESIPGVICEHIATKKVLFEYLEKRIDKHPQISLEKNPGDVSKEISVEIPMKYSLK